MKHEEPFKMMEAQIVKGLMRVTIYDGDKRDENGEQKVKYRFALTRGQLRELNRYAEIYESENN